MNLEALQNDEYRTALAEIEHLWLAELGSLEGHRFSALVRLIDDYERREHPIWAPEPIEALRFRLEQQQR